MPPYSPVLFPVEEPLPAQGEDPCYRRMRLYHISHEFLLNIIYIDPLIKWIQNYACDKIFEIINEQIAKIKQ